MLAAVNAKYIHSNLAVYSLKAYADARLRQSKSPVSSAGHAAGEVEIEIGEYTINQQPDRIMEDIYKRRPDLLCFSCYIWNIQMIRSLLPELGKVLRTRKSGWEGRRCPTTRYGCWSSSPGDRDHEGRGGRDLRGSGGSPGSKRSGPGDRFGGRRGHHLA